MKKIPIVIILLAVITHSEEEGAFTLSFVLPQTILTGISLAHFDTEIESGNAIRYNNELTMKAVSLSTGFTINYFNDNFLVALSTIIPIGDIFSGGDEVEYEAWFWGVSSSISFPLVNLDTFKLILNGDYQLNYFRKRKYVEPKGLYDEVYHYAGFGFTIALIDYNTELDKPHHNSWLFTQGLGYSWDGGLTGISSISWQGTGIFDSIDKDSDYIFFPAIGVEAIYSSSYFYLRYFWEFISIL